MSNIVVQVYTMSGDELEISTPTDIRVSEFIRELISAKNFPSEDAEGNPIQWRLDNESTGTTLDDQSTFQEEGVDEGHRLFLIRTVTAGGGPIVELIASGKSVRKFKGKNKEKIYGFKGGSLLIPQVMLPFLREHIENDSISKWFDRSIGFFLGASLAFLLPLFDDKLSTTFRGVLIGGLALSFVATIVLILLEIKIGKARKRGIDPLLELLSTEPEDGAVTESRSTPLD